MHGSLPVALRMSLAWAVLCQVALAQQPQTREPIDPTPPPRGTASFEPPPALAEDAPLTAQTFVIRAAIVNISETDLAELAVSRSQDAAIQGYARRMLTEHRRAQEKLRAAADEFDAGYVKAIVAGHDQAVALFDAASHSKTLPQPLQRYAIEMLPIVRNHRDAAYTLQSQRGG